MGNPRWPPRVSSSKRGMDKTKDSSIYYPSLNFCQHKSEGNLRLHSPEGTACFGRFKRNPGRIRKFKVYR